MFGLDLAGRRLWLRRLRRIGGTRRAALLVGVIALVVGLHLEGWCRYQPVLLGLRARALLPLGYSPNTPAIARASDNPPLRDRIFRSGGIRPICSFRLHVLFLLRLYPFLLDTRLPASGPYEVFAQG